MEKTVTDNGNNSVVADATETADNRHKANATALAYAKAVIKNETALSLTAKQWGGFVFNAVYTDGNNLDTIIGENKLAAGWAKLGDSDEGRKAKQRLNTLFSGARLVAERYSSLSDEQRNGILNGTVSVLYIASEMRRLDREAKAAEAKAEAEANPAAATDSAPSVKDMAEALLTAYTAASQEARDEAFDAMAALFEAVDADTNANAVSDETAEAKAA